MGLAANMQPAYANTGNEEAGACMRSAEGTDNTIPKYRSWNEQTASWNALKDLPDAGANAIEICRIEFSPVEDRIIIVTQDSTGLLDLYTCTLSCDTGSNWTLEESDFADTYTTALSTPHRQWDIMFEKTSGDLLVVYDKEVTEVNDFYYRVWDTTTTSWEAAEAGFNYINGVTSDANDIRYIGLAQDKSAASDEIAMTLLDTTTDDVYDFIWDGSNFGNQHTCTADTGTTSDDFLGTGIVYETGSDDAIISCANGTNSMDYAQWNGATWDDFTAEDPNSSAANDIQHVMMRANPASGSTEVMFCNIDDLRDFNCREWDGTALTGSWTKIDAAVFNTNSKVGDFSYDSSGGTGVAIYADTTLRITTRDFTGTSFDAEDGTLVVVGDEQWFEGEVNPTDAESTNSLWISRDSQATTDIGTARWIDNDPATLISDTQPTTDASTNIDLQTHDLGFRIVTTQDVTETLASSDVALKYPTKVRQETLASSDVAVKQPTKSLTETLAMSDAINFAVQFVRILNESLIMTDTNIRAFSKRLDDTLSLSDTVSTIRETTITLSDTLASSDTVSTNVAKTITLSDTLASSDSVPKSSSKLLTDTLASSDVVTSSIARTITLTDTLASSDTVSTNVAKTITLTDTLAQSDAIITNGDRTITLTDTLAQSDAVSTGKSVTLAETLTLSDAISTESALGTLHAETLSVSDTIELIVTIPSPAPSSTPVTVTFLGSTAVLGGGNITFPSISTAGTVTVGLLNNGPAVPPELTLVNWIGSVRFVDISTTATFTVPLQIAVRYNDTGIESQEIDITLQHFNGVSWEDITTSVDTANNIVYGQTNSLSPFGVMIKPGRLGGTGGGGPAYEIIDLIPPVVETPYYQPAVPFAGQELSVIAKVIDDVSISKAYVLYFINSAEPEFHQVEMEKQGNPGYFIGTIPASHVRTVGLTYWIFAEDFGKNNAQSSVQKVEVKEAISAPPPKPSQKNLPTHVLEAIKPKYVEPVEKLEVTSMNSGNEITAFSDKIIIKNIGNRTVDDIRIMLSSEISKSFRISEPAIKSIEPNGNVTVTFELNGSPNKDMVGGLVGYTGKLIIMAEHLSPMMLPVNIGAEPSDYLSEHMDKIASMAEQRYNKISLLNSILSNQAKTEYNYEVTTSDGDNVITSASDELLIKNLSDKELKNVRIYVSNAGHAFLLEKNNIRSLEPNGQISIKLIPKIDSEKYSPKDFKGELLIVPSNDNPIQIPINISGEERKDSADEFEIRTLSGKDSIYTAEDKIIIKNLGNRTLDSVRLMLPVDLARVFMLSNDSFKRIEPNSEVIVDLKFREELGEHKMGIQYNYEGKLTIVSEHHRAKEIPINISWNEVSSDHFLIYSRSGSDIAKANEIIAFLESNYQNITSRFGEMNTKTRIYMTNTLEELRMVADSGHSYYAFSDDVIFICGCDEDVKSLAMKELVYRITFNKYPNYSNKEKFMLDGKNWLMDGIADYIASNITDGQMVKQIEAFKEKPTSFVWYGSGTEEQYGATYTFFEYLQGKYGEKVIDKTLYYLGSVMVSNHRCDTLEDCAVLRAVYDVSGLDMKKKRNALDVEILVKDWGDYVAEHYGIAMPKKDQN